MEHHQEEWSSRAGIQFKPMQMETNRIRIIIPGRMSELYHVVIEPPFLKNIKLSASA